MKFVTAMFIGVALIVGVAIGYMFNPSVDEPAVERARQSRGAVRDEGDAATIASLRARIAELEAKRGTKVEDKVENRGPFVGLSPKEWREKMKKENPQEYAQITNGMARWRRERFERAQKKVDFLSSIDVSKMSAAARKTHEELQSLIAKREEFEEKMHNLFESADDLSPESRREIFREMHETDQQIRELNSRERENLMLETAKNLGFSNEEAAEIAETFQEIVENTEGGFNTTGRPSRGGRNGGFGGGNFLPPPPR